MMSCSLFFKEMPGRMISGSLELDAGRCSARKPECRLEYTATEVLKAKAFGFSRVPGAVRFTFGLAATTSTFVITKSGAGQNFPGSNMYAVGDKFKIERALVIRFIFTTLPA